MISPSRVLTVVKKDLAWASGNLKLLGVMVLPLFVVVFFSRFDATATFGFSLIFVNAFVGIFSTSYLVIEEKNKGTLLALLTSPLTGSELLLGKFLFNLILCSFFSLLVILLNNRMDLFLQPLALLNIFLFAGTTCFVGFVTGVFFKNEQEMSVLAPFLMVLFCFGDAAEKVSDKNNIHAFFPDFHVARSVLDIPMSFGDLWGHTLFSLCMFFVAFGMATFYTQFYFSNNREKRFSNRLVGFVVAFVGVLIGSGIYANATHPHPKMQGSLEVVEFQTPQVQVQYKFDPKVFRHKTLLESRKKIVELLTFKNEKNSNVVLAIRDLDEDENSLAKRKAKVEEDRSRNIISFEERDWKGHRFRQWMYAKRSRFIVLRETYCDGQVFQVSMDLQLKKMGRFYKDFKIFKSLFDAVEMKCL